MARRDALTLALNAAGHHYEWCRGANAHVCRDCGTAEHVSGDFYYAWHKYREEPGCYRGRHYKGRPH